MDTMTATEKKSLVNQVSLWFHTFDFGDGATTKGVISPEVQTIICSAFPQTLAGKTVLDVGACDGYYSFICEQRGAKATAVDNNLHKLGHNSFYTAKKLLNSNVEFLEKDLFDFPKWEKKFDVVLFLGVLYHLKNPLEALEILYPKVGELLILESHYIKTKGKEPLMRFYPGAELCGDSSNWWGPNIQCILDMLKAAGFKNSMVFKSYNDSRDMGRVIVKALK